MVMVLEDGREGEDWAEEVAGGVVMVGVELFGARRGRGMIGTVSAVRGERASLLGVMRREDWKESTMLDWKLERELSVLWTSKS